MPVDQRGALVQRTCDDTGELLVHPFCAPPEHIGNSCAEKRTSVGFGPAQKRRPRKLAQQATPWQRLGERLHDPRWGQVPEQKKVHEVDGLSHHALWPLLFNVLRGQTFEVYVLCDERVFFAKFGHDPIRLQRAPCDSAGGGPRNCAGRAWPFVR